MININNEILIKTAAILDQNSQSEAADVLDNFLAMRAVVTAGLQGGPLPNAQQLAQNKNQFMLDFGSTYHLVQHSIGIDPQSMSALTGIFNQINRLLNHHSASILAVRTVIAGLQSAQSPVQQQANSITTCIQSVQNVMASAKAIPGYNNVNMLLQQALTILNGLNTGSNRQEVTTQQQANQQANQQAMLLSAPTVATNVQPAAALPSA